MTINVVVDLSESFATPGGSFACGTTPATRARAAALARAADLVVYATDVHTPRSTEFAANGGLFPPHHLLATRGGRAVPGSSPRPAPELAAALAARPALVCAPRYVYYPDGTDADGDGSDGDGAAAPCVTAADLAAEFGAPVAPGDIDAAAAALVGRGGRVSLLVSAKGCFDGALDVPLRHTAARGGAVAGVPDGNYTAFALLRHVYGLGRGMRFVVDGVVLSICVYQTASSLRQLFPQADVVVACDACTPLPGEPVPGVSWEAVVRAMCEQIGIRCTPPTAKDDLP